MSSKANIAITALCVVVMMILLSGIGVFIWKHQFDDANVETRAVLSSSAVGGWAEFLASSEGILFHSSKESDARKDIKGILGKDHDAKLAKTCDYHNNEQKDGLCLQWNDGFQVEVYEKSGLKSTNDMQCVTVDWRIDNKNKNETYADCFVLNPNFWFGGFESSTQDWPMNSYQKNLTAFVTADSFQGGYFGSVIDSIFISSAGFAIIVDETTPLYVSVNQDSSNSLCLMGKVGNDTPFFNVPKPFLKYDICASTDIVLLWKSMSLSYFPKPLSVPSSDVFRFPIWCTWALYKANINQTIVLDYAKDIVANSFKISQLEIDDSWTLHYGDFNFTSDRFPDAVSMISNLTEMGISATIWMHPFFNNDSEAFKELSAKGLLIKELNSDNPHLVSWWRGTNIAGVLDFTSPQAVDWYLNKLSYLKAKFNVTSFKFDAGELSWVSGEYRLNSSLSIPTYLTTKYIEMTYRADQDQRRQEVRSGFRSQNSTLMLRMLDRLSDWSHTFGIKTLIPCSLVFGMMGYPYVLPDLIGGNAYSEGFPDPELFVRWLQATTFMPVLQFSIPPWKYNKTVLEISKRYVNLHEQYADKIIALAVNAQKTGEPINRPLWWIAPNDDVALHLDSEFLLGDDLLVAPILDQGATSRDIYLPSGQWRDEQKGLTLQGGSWIRTYSAPLDILPYFTKVG